MLANINKLCPILSIYSYNCYAPHARLFVIGGKELRSKEGTTQGDPPSMSLYAIGLMPLLFRLSEHFKSNEANPPNIKNGQVAYADDLTGGGKLKLLRKWFEDIVKFGPTYGYYAEPTKSWLIVKERCVDEATNLFTGTGVNITSNEKKTWGSNWYDQL